jgi:hypothetical protein
MPGLDPGIHEFDASTVVFRNFADANAAHGLPGQAL